VLRSGSEVKCFLPEEKLVIIENRASQRGISIPVADGLGQFAGALFDS
jgi:hypothetical protein